MPMTSTSRTGVLLTAAALLVFGAGRALTDELSKFGCVTASPPLTISAEGPAYDVPGGAKIGYVRRQTKYVMVAALRHTDGEAWILLVGPGGVHAGWITASSVKANYLPTIRCESWDILYSRPQQ